MAREVIARGLSVRETEALVKRDDGHAAGRRPRSRPRRTCTRAPPRSSCASRSARAVTIHRKRKGGTLEIAFTNEDELQRIYEYLTERK